MRIVLGNVSLLNVIMRGCTKGRCWMGFRIKLILDLCGAMAFCVVQFIIDLAPKEAIGYIFSSLIVNDEHDCLVICRHLPGKCVEWPTTTTLIIP